MIDEEWGQSREEKEFYVPTPEQVVRAPEGLKGEKLARWYERDLIKAIGSEYIDHGGHEQPFIKRVKKKKIPMNHGNRVTQSTGLFPF